MALRAQRTAAQTHANRYNRNNFTKHLHQFYNTSKYTNKHAPNPVSRGKEKVMNPAGMHLFNALNSSLQGQHFLYGWHHLCCLQHFYILLCCISVYQVCLLNWAVTVNMQNFYTFILDWHEGIRGTLNCFTCWWEGTVMSCQMHQIIS